MKTDLHQAAQTTSIAGTGAIITLADINGFVTIAVGVTTLVYLAVQTVVLLWKFYHMRKEKAAGKRLVETKPGAL